MSGMQQGGGPQSNGMQGGMGQHHGQGGQMQVGQITVLDGFELVCWQKHDKLL